MLVKTKAIVISTLKYQEKSLIVKCFTQSDGLKTYFVRDAFSNKKTSQKNAYFQPLTLIEIEAIHKNKNTLETLKEIKINTPLHGIHTNIFKSTIVLFLAEMLQNAIREEEKNDPLFIYLETALIWLDSNTKIANFHLITLLEISKYLGFYPNTNHIHKPFFELIEGTFSNNQAISSLNETQTNLFKNLIALKISDTQNHFLNHDRQTLLKIIIDYYALHLNGFKRPKSIDILKEIFQ